MRKYLFIFHTSVLSKLQYIGNMFGNVIIYAFIIFMFTRLWPFIFDDRNSLFGYSLNQIVWYVAITEFIWFSMRSNFIRSEIAQAVKSGQIAYMLNKPYNYIFYVISKYFGETIISFSFNIITTIIIGTVMIGRMETFKINSIPFLLITFFLAALIFVLIYLMIALVSFWFEENKPFIWIYEKFVLILGIMFPIEIFPYWAQIYIKITPIYTSIYAPAKMTVDFSITKWLELTLIQLIYIIAALMIISIIFNKGVRKLYVNGG